MKLPPLAVATAALALAQTDRVDFARDVEPILRARCHACHGERVQNNGLRLDSRDHALRGGYSGVAIQPGSSASSKLHQMIAAGKMPPGGARLPEREASAIARWIDQGAHWPATSAITATKPKPWSFEPIRRPDAQGIDDLVLAELRKHRLAPSPEAPRHVLLRRLYLDLIGLPPTVEESAEFLGDTRANAYERLVDRLLESPHFGEKWARHWLDLARYADSEGGVQDYARPYAWRYREWVINALNRDMPFDQFTIEQLAGDLLPAPTLSQKIATGFHRQTITSREGGIDLEKLRYDQLVDRANTTATVWLGLTAGCAQCHDHKYDPITQRDYYSLVAFFENSMERDLEAPLPGELGVFRGYIGKYREERLALIEQYKIMPLEREWEDEVRKAAASPGVRPNWDVAYDSMSKLLDHGPRILHTKLADRTPREQDAIVDHFLKYGAKGLGKERYDALKLKEAGDKAEELRKKHPDISMINTLVEDSRRVAPRIRLRGNYKDLGVEVEPAVPASLPPLPAGRVDRLALAKWLVSPANPLTARVVVNRLWQELFGSGLVRTSEDFGIQGEKPSHPELLDWLSSEFRDRGWSMKRMVRLMVTSATYKQSSGARSEPQATMLLARQSRLRLPAELIRDSALHAGGMLMDAVGGESVRPPQPEGVADLQYSMKWEETTGRTRYRRGLYIHMQRTAAYPLLMNFDAPDRTVSCSRRESSNTPLQPLNLMNDPVFNEAAQALAARILKEASTPSERVDLAFRICFARAPTPGERDAVLSHLDRRRAFARTADAEETAWYGASRALINSSEFLTRE